MTSNDINVNDINDIYLYTKDNYLISYLAIGNINIDLLSNDEIEKLVYSLSMSFQEDRRDFSYFSLPSQVDLDPIKEYLRRVYASTENKHRRKGLNIMLKEIMYLSTSGTNFEHQHFIKLWKKIGTNLKDTQKELYIRANEFRERYKSVNISCEILKEKDIIKICNLFGNPSQAPYTSVDESSFYEKITQIGE